MKTLVYVKTELEKQKVIEAANRFNFPITWLPVGYFASLQMLLIDSNVSSSFLNELKKGDILCVRQK